MRFVILILTQILFLSASVFAQQAKYQTFKAKMTLIGEKDAVQKQWDNENITVALDYQTGNFISRMHNTDFNEKYASGESANDEIKREDIVLKGIFPIERIIDQKSINASYDVEMELITSDESIILNFTVEVTKPGEGKASYRIFIMRSTLYNDQTNFKAFEGYENEISIILALNAYWNN